MFKVGSHIGEYEVVARLKSGGMATLYLGRRGGAAGFARYVAIKVVHPHLAVDDTFVSMFIDEAKLCARIAHPNVVHVEELGTTEGTYFLVMEYVNGCSLAQLLRSLAVRQRGLSPELAVHIAARIADGLHAAHETTDDAGKPLGVVHRDVSPQNILLAYKGHVKLIDFGVAKAEGRAAATTTRSLKGKLRYMSPEQAYGRDVDRRADVYALGIILWEMLTMRRLFQSENDFALLDEVREPKIVPPSTHVSGISKALDDAIMKALSVVPSDRFATAQDFRRALTDAVPAALAIEAGNVAELLGVLMADEIQKERRELPESISEVLRLDAPPERLASSISGVVITGVKHDDEVLKTMTTVMPDITFEDDDGKPASPPPAIIHAALDRSEFEARRRWIPRAWLAAGIVSVGAASYIALTNLDADGRAHDGSSTEPTPPLVPARAAGDAAAAPDAGSPSDDSGARGEPDAGLDAGATVHDASRDDGIRRSNRPRTAVLPDTTATPDAGPRRRNPQTKIIDGVPIVPDFEI